VWPDVNTVGITGLIFSYLILKGTWSRYCLHFPSDQEVKHVWHAFFQQDSSIDPAATAAMYDLRTVKPQVYRCTEENFQHLL
jgi:hypothetical protein